MYFPFDNSLDFVTLLILLSLISDGQETHVPYHELPPYDGWYNNLVHPDWGAIGIFFIWVGKLGHIFF